MRDYYGQTKWARPISCQVVALSFEYVLLLNRVYLTLRFILSIYSGNEG